MSKFRDIFCIICKSRNLSQLSRYLSLILRGTSLMKKKLTDITTLISPSLLLKSQFTTHTNVIHTLLYIQWQLRTKTKHKNKMSMPVQYTSSNFNLILYILSTYYNLGRKSINIQRHLPNCLEPSNYIMIISGRRL